MPAALKKLTGQLKLLLGRKTGFVPLESLRFFFCDEIRLRIGVGSAYSVQKVLFKLLNEKIIGVGIESVVYAPGLGRNEPARFFIVSDKKFIVNRFVGFSDFIPKTLDNLPPRRYNTVVT